MTDNTKTCLSPVEQKFILHWSEIGTRWGVNRTVAQVHALLFLSPRPLSAEEIATRSRKFARVESIAWFYGMLRGVTYAEPFVQKEVRLVDDVMTIPVKSI